MTNREEIIRALRLLFSEGDVFEIRILKAVSTGYQRPHTESGYFDYEHIPRAADAIAKIRSFAGAYVTLNPVDPDLLARAFNRLGPAEQNATTADDDIVRRRWLPIDCDAVRKSNISSTDDEHAAALELAEQIRNGLASVGWPQPVMLDSGNGAQLLYRIDLPAKDDGLVQNVIASIAAASTDQVHVDLTVFNPARIWRIPGTMNCKGDSIPTRPHRMAHIASVPDEVREVSRELLVAAARCEAAEPQAKVETESHSGFNLDDWILRHSLDVKNPVPYNGGRKWVFKVCPFNNTHTNGSAVLIEEPSGAVAFRCHHNSCSGNDWHKLREMYEPGCYDKPKTAELQPADVDISGITKQTICEPEPVIADEPPWRMITSDDVRKAISGTVFGEICDLLSIVTDPPLPIEAAIPKALALCGAALSQRKSTEDLKRGDGNLSGVIGFGKTLGRLRINTAEGQTCNFFSLRAAPSGSGKDIGSLVDIVANYFGWYIGSSGSAEGLADAYISMPNGILLISELQPFLDEKRWQHNATDFLLTAFNKGFFKHNLSTRGKGVGTRVADYCAPNIIAYVQPDVFPKVASISDIQNGLLGRFLFSNMPEFCCEPNVYDHDALVQEISHRVAIFKRKYGVVQVDKGYANELNRIFQKAAPPELSASWHRLTGEYYPRLAVVLSVRRNKETQREAVVLTQDCWERAAILALWFFGQAERLLLRVNDASPKAKEREMMLWKVFRKIRYLDRGNGVSTREISMSGIRNSNAKERSEALRELEERGIIARIENGNRYFIVKTPPEWVE